MSEAMDTKENAEAQIISIEAGEPWPADAFSWFKFWGGEIVKGTMHMNNEQVAALMFLMVHYWEHGWVPEEEEVLCRITR